MTKTATIKWEAFSDKHKEYIRNTMYNRFNVAEGAIRAGKTIDNCIGLSIYLETCEDRIHLASGSTVANAKTNIADCNGYGLEHLFRGRCHAGKYKDNECLYINTKTGEKIVLFVGGGKADSYKKILGNSYGAWIATEINQHYDSDDSETSFIKVALGRQVAAKQPKIFWDLNPSNPRHRIYTNYIDKYKMAGLEGGYNYQHFTIADNLSVSEERRREIISMYNPTSIWYKRDILGERCVAEGLVYQQFADHPDDYTISLNNVVHNLIWANIGVDFGGNKSATTFVCTGFTRGFELVVPLLSERHTEALNPDKLNKAFADFVKKCYSIVHKPLHVYADSAETVLINGLEKTALLEGLPAIVGKAKKNPIKQRIELLSMLIAKDRFYVTKEAKTVRQALCEVVYDPKAIDDTRLDNCTTDVDTCDALEYSIEPFMAELLRS